MIRTHRAMGVCDEKRAYLAESDRSPYTAPLLAPLLRPADRLRSAADLFDAGP